MDYYKVKKNRKSISQTVFGCNDPNRLWNKIGQKKKLPCIINIRDY